MSGPSKRNSVITKQGAGRGFHSAWKTGRRQVTNMGSDPQFVAQGAQGRGRSL